MAKDPFGSLLEKQDIAAVIRACPVTCGRRTEPGAIDVTSKVSEL